FFRETGPSGRAAVDLVGADVNEAGEFSGAGRFQQALRASHIGTQKRRGVVDAAVDMRFCSEIDTSVKAAMEQIRNESRIADVAKRKLVAGIGGQVGQAFRISGISQFVQIHNVNIAPGMERMSNKIRTDEACAARYQEFQCDCSL